MKVDDGESYGEVPGTVAYEMRAQDAIPDELEVIPEGGDKGMSVGKEDQAKTPGTASIPKTVVEMIDSTPPSHADVHGTAAHSNRRADAVPNVITHASLPEQGSSNSSDEIPIPKTVVTKVDEAPSQEEIPGTEAHEIRKADAEPDVVEKKGDIPGKTLFFQLLFSERLTEAGLPTSSLSRSTISAPKRRKQSLVGSPIAADGGFGPMTYEESDDSDDEKADDKHEVEEEGAEEGFGDDFDDFEAGAEGEDFGEFDDGFQGSKELPVETEKPAQPDTSSLSPFVSSFSIGNQSSRPHVANLLGSKVTLIMPFHNL